ncbi:MAG: 4'-phosphopantetheinyl transferase superfamily protein [Lachnospiraceae bacterium]|nr:4'-phosphopantetheinyl transferase superfamily protein [Lachnospiraceae bacterium]
MILYMLDMEWFEKSGYCEAGQKSKKHHQAGQFLLQYALGKESYQQAEFTVGEHGKPYIRNSSIHYNISHSGSYVVLVTGTTELGVDIQEKKSARLEAMAKRFFAKEEWQAFADCNTIEEQRDLFYHIWCRKEAYGKYLGVGLNEAVLHTNVLEKVEGCSFMEYDGPEGYQISICCGKEEEIEEVISVFEGL